MEAELERARRAGESLRPRPARPRQLQGHQRHERACRRRRAAVLGGRRAATGRPPDGLDRPSWRRRVRDPDAGRDRKRCRARRHTGAQAAVRKGRGVHRAPPASRCTARTRTRCSGTPTASSTRASTATAEHFAAGRRELTWAATLARAVDARMATPVEHSTIVARYAAGTAERLGWTGPDLAHISASPRCCTTSARSCSPTASSRSRKPLDPLEFEEVKRHPETGAELINRVEGLGPIADWVRHSHEHSTVPAIRTAWPGTHIPLASRILLVADAFDAITSDRPYRPAQTHGGRAARSCAVTREPVRPALRRRPRTIVPHGHRVARPGPRRPRSSRGPANRVSASPRP